MASVADFVGCWEFKWMDSQKEWLQQDWLLLIGTGSGWGDSPPFLTAEYAVCVGFAVLSQDAEGNFTVVELSTESGSGHQPLVLRLTGDQLRWKGYYRAPDEEPQPLYIYISTAETWVPDGRSYTHLYGSTTYGDPDQVGVWGASSSPPPPPPPSPKQDDGGQG
jgi:hypothetical protein